MEGNFDIGRGKKLRYRKGGENYNKGRGDGNQDRGMGRKIEIKKGGKTDI